MDSKQQFSFPGCRVLAIKQSNPVGIEVKVIAAAKSASCPVCHVASRTVHGSYVRTATDLPSLGKTVLLEIKVRRFYCKNAKCPRRTFAEKISAVIAPRARRTQRLLRAQATVAIACGGEAGSRLLRVLGMDTSPDSLLRLIRLMPLPKLPTTHVLGVDDWAIKKGRSYGTILVDLEAHKVVDLLPDRTAQTLATWLQKKNDKLSRTRPLDGVSSGHSNRRSTRDTNC